MAPTTPDDLRDRIDRLADAVTGAGRLADPRWRDALLAAPRHLFLPAVAWAQPDRPGAQGYVIDRERAPGTWWEAVYSDTVVVTQAADGTGDIASGEGPWTSSCSAPGIVMRFLDQLALLDHHRVLEIGTGTGWTAALLSWRVGEHNVSSIEVDATVAAGAAEHLKAAGYAPRLVTGDGAEGVPDGAPYDRVHVTCGVARLPYAWVVQSRPGAVIVFPWSTGWSYGHLTRLTVTGDGRAIGGFAGPAGFMMLRGQRRPSGDPGRLIEDAAQPVRSATRLDPRSVAWDSPGSDVAIAAQVPGSRSLLIPEQDGGWRFGVLENRPGGSWASVAYLPGQADFLVEQDGQRRLWDEVEAAYLRWVSWGRPERERFGLAVTPTEQLVWLDSPDHIICP